MPNPTLDSLRLKLEQDRDLKLAILFGSFGTLKEKSASDLDIAIAMDKAMSPEIKLEKMTMIEHIVKRSVDLIDLQTASGTVLKESLTTGRMILNRDSDLLARIHVRMISDEEDFQKRKRSLAAEARKRIFHVKGSEKPKT